MKIVERSDSMKRFMVAIVGVIFLGVGIFMYIQNKNLVKNCTEKAEATVVDMKEEFSSDSDMGSYLYYPIIEYNVKGQNVRVTMSSGSNVPAYSINDKIAILYNPNKVEEFIVDGDKMSGIISIVFIALGVIVTGYGVVVAFKNN